MIKKLKLVNFRNFLNREFLFSDNKNFIIGENGKGKTNILESLSLLTGTSITGVAFENLVNHNSDFFHIDISNQRDDSLSLFYDKKLNKKKYSINSKATTKKKFGITSLTSVIFSPIIMNMMYLSPSLRRDFLDTILVNSFGEYEEILKSYKSALTSRNKLLKNISAGKSSKDEIHYWNELFIKNAIKLYKYREKIVNYLSKNSQSLLHGFSGKVSKIQFQYVSKINFLGDISDQIKNYLEKNLERDIILKTTSIGPHRDDFKIIINNKVSIVDFASRGEVKTTILGLKNLEVKFIEKNTQRKPILIIDDLLSELDKKHKDFLIENIYGYQTFISGIELTDVGNNNLIKL